MENWNEYYEKLTALGISGIEISIEGSGDDSSTNISDIIISEDSILNTLKNVKGKTDSTVFESVLHSINLIIDGIEVSLYDSILEKAYAEAQAMCPGFENNDGGGGVIFIYPLEKRINVIIDYYDDASDDEEFDEDETDEFEVDVNHPGMVN